MAEEEVAVRGRDWARPAAGESGGDDDEVIWCLPLALARRDADSDDWLAFLVEACNDFFLGRCVGALGAGLLLWGRGDGGGSGDNGSSGESSSDG